MLSWVKIYPQVIFLVTLVYSRNLLKTNEQRILSIQAFLTLIENINFLRRMGTYKSIAQIFLLAWETQRYFPNQTDVFLRKLWVTMKKKSIKIFCFPKFDNFKWTYFLCGPNNQGQYLDVCALCVCVFMCVFHCKKKRFLIKETMTRC